MRFGTGLLLFALLWSGTAAAQDPSDEAGNAEPGGVLLYDGGAFSLRAGLQATTAIVAVRNAGAGAGTRSLADGHIIRSPVWNDGFIKPDLTAAFENPEGLPGIAYGGLSFISAWTLGSGDAYAPPNGIQQTRGGSWSAGVESAYLGWRSAAGAGATSNGLDLSAGRQEFLLGDGFLVGDGHYDRGGDAGYYSGGRIAWTNSAVLRAAALPIRADLFWLRGDRNGGGGAIAGVNGELVDSARGKLGFAWMRVLSDNPAASGYESRDGMQIFDLRGRGTPFAGLPGLSLAAEFAQELNNASPPRRLSAAAWYGEIGYSLSDWRWKPALTYRHAHFSGDKRGTARQEGWDPLRYSGRGDWGTWFMGEIVGEYMLFNSNEEVDMLHARLQPLDEVTLGALFYRFRYDRPDSVATGSGRLGVASAEFGHEVDLYADWQPLPYLDVSAVLGLFVPSRGAKEAYGSGRETGLIETVISFKF